MMEEENAVRSVEKGLVAVSDDVSFELLKIGLYLEPAILTSLDQGMTPI